jgi:hypothetical protein
MSDFSDDERSIQCCGSFDALTDEYSFTATSSGLCVTFEFLSRADVIEMKDCLECMLVSDVEATEDDDDLN